MNPRVMAQLRQRQLTILNTFDEICRKHDLRYYLMYGTLLGAVRHNGYIPWDDDIDVAMPIEDYLKFLKIGQQNLPENMFLQTDMTDSYHARFFAKIRMNNTAFVPQESLTSKKHVGIFIDIFPLYKRPPQQNSLKKIRIKLGNIIDTVLIDKRERNKLSRMIFLPFYILPSKLLAKLRYKLWNLQSDYYYEFECNDYYPIEIFESTIDLIFEDRAYPAPKDYDKVLRTLYGDYMQLPPEDQRVTHNPFRISFDLSGPDENLDDDS